MVRLVILEKMFPRHVDEVFVDRGDVCLDGVGNILSLEPGLHGELGFFVVRAALSQAVDALIWEGDGRP